ncbi:DUF134 domain-containing protein [Candidatus Micrarchaeota archaeon]|jgi:hypothetical protein|nr:DUF134 domain-containing protein [Candidatus Micrarchaeota archaeon]
MPRPRRFRRIGKFPCSNCYKPIGIPVTDIPEEVIINYDELEAVRLTSLQELSQIEAAKQMGISQPTLHRLIASFEKKIADALINGKIIKIEGDKWVTPGFKGSGGFGRGRRRLSNLAGCIRPKD